MAKWFPSPDRFLHLGEVPGADDATDPEWETGGADAFEDVAEAPEPPGLVAGDPVLALQHMEAALARADLAHPDILSREQFRKLRYLLSFARLTVFEPGAAGPGGERGRGDVDVTDHVAPLRARVVAALHDPLRREPDLRARLLAARALLPGLEEPLGQARAELAGSHAALFSAAELDAEVGYKKLVTVLGGGGGAGYVYLGAMERLVEEGLTPDYLLAGSFGAVVGCVVAREAPVPMAQYLDWARTVTFRGILGPARRGRRHGMNGVISLHFDDFADPLFRRVDGGRTRLADLAIPFETVVSGVRRQSFDKLPEQLRASSAPPAARRAARLGLRPAVAARMWQAAALIDSQVVKPIVLGGDRLTAQLNVVDAVSFSAAIPGVLHHETKDPAMVPILDALMAEKDVAALVDGVATSNVPVELAWKRVRDGRLGTRNVVVYAWDCFHPQWNPKHLWLQPVTQAVAIQMVRNAPFADYLVRFSPTLSVLTLAAPPAAFTRAVGWGRESVGHSLPFVRHLLEPVWWDGDGPPPVGARPPAAAGGAAPEPMRVVLDSARAAARRAALGVTRWARPPWG